MSLYSHQYPGPSQYPSGSYGHSSYPSSSSQPYSGYNGHHPQQSPPQHNYYSPPAPPPSNPTPQETIIFRDWFMAQLAPLVENNRSIIHRIAFIAREHVERFAPLISQCLEMHIRRVHPTVKLPPFYLLDSISKNLGNPYAHLFSKFIVSLFIDTYHAVDDNVRAKMEEMLVTWRTGGPAGVELFGAHAQQAIERAVWGEPESHGGPTSSQVIIELDVILAQKTRAVEQNPADSGSRNHIATLQQLRQMVSTSPLPASELAVIMSRLRDLARSTALAAPPLPPMAPPPPSAPTQQTYSYPPATMAQAPLAPTYHTPTPPPAPPVASILSSMLNQSAPFGTATPPLQAHSVGPDATAPPSLVPDVSKLMKGLIAAGLVPGVNMTSMAEQQQAAEDDSPKIEPIVIDHKLVALREYERKILGLSVSLSSSGLQQSQPEVISLMYEKLPLQCKQCAKRFSDDEAGIKARDDHLDVHFRQNRRLAQAAGRGHTRSWFVGFDDWIHEAIVESTPADVKGKGRADGLAPGGGAPTSARVAAAAASEREAKLRAMFVVIPSGDESKTMTCPICKETLKIEFMEDEEEWVYRNAMNVKGTLYHATCHSDALATMLAARMREQAAGKRSRSRSGTPESSVSTTAEGGVGTPLTSSSPHKPAVLSSPPSSSLLGTKRKAPSEERDASHGFVKQEPTDWTVQRTDTPPIKRPRSSDGGLA